jgi:hypothetical protein
MAEEVRFFLRTTLYSAAVGVLYWYISYEVAGSVMLAFVVLATGLVVGFLTIAVRATRGELAAGDGGPVTRLALTILQTVGFVEPRTAALEEPLAAGLGRFPRGSAWPMIGGAGALLVGLGLVYGPWLLLPGIVVVAFTVWGWITQFDVRR